VRATGPQRAALAGLFGFAALQCAWNLWQVPALTGYDDPAHAGYALTWALEQRWPHPMEGWSTFHPPLWYWIASRIWRLLDAADAQLLMLALRLPGALAILALAGLCFAACRRVGTSFGSAWVATAVALFLPAAQMAGAMLGNEALAAGFAAAALLPLLALQREPERLGSAAAAGLFAGLALATKYSGAFAALACAVPFLRPGWNARRLRAAAAAGLVASAVAGPIYARNWLLTGTPFPILREHEPTASQEARNVLRPRRVADYLWIDPAALRRPSIYHVAGDASSELRRNPAMTNVFGLALASSWYDAFAHRIPTPYHRDGVWSGQLLVALGLVPTGLALFGLARAARAAFASRLRSETAPLAAIWGLGLAGFVGFTAWAPSLVAVKGSYLLPLLPAGCVFLAQTCDWLRPDLRRLAHGVSTAAALAAALVFWEGLLFEPQPVEKMARTWRVLGAALPGSHIAESVDRLVP